MFHLSAPHPEFLVLPLIFFILHFVLIYYRLYPFPLLFASSAANTEYRLSPHTLVRLTQTLCKTCQVTESLKQFHRDILRWKSRREKKNNEKCKRVIDVNFDGSMDTTCQIPAEINPRTLVRGPAGSDIHLEANCTYLCMAPFASWERRGGLRAGACLLAPRRHEPWPGMVDLPLAHTISLGSTGHY